MKKLFVLFAAALLVAASPLQAQTKAELSSIRKEAKKTSKKLTRDGFRMLEAGQLDDRMADYLIKVHGGCTQLVGTAEGCMSINLAKVTALNNAANEYATLSGGLVKGRLTTSVNNLSDLQTDDLVGAYERLVYKKIQGEIISPIILVRKTKSGYDVRAYCLVDYNASLIAQKSAFQKAIEESGLAQEYGSQLSDWIDEGFEKMYDRD